MESKRTTRASSTDVNTRRGTRKSPGRKRSPSPIVEEPSPKTKAAPKSRPKSASRAEKTAPKSPKKASKTEKSKADKDPLPSPQKKSPRGRPAGKTTTTTASTISTTSTTKTLTLSSSAELKLGGSSLDSGSKRGTSMTPMTTRSMSRSMSRSVYDREYSDNEEDRPSSVSFAGRSLSRQPKDRFTVLGLSGQIALLVAMIAVTVAVTSSRLNSLNDVKNLWKQFSCDWDVIRVHLALLLGVGLIAILPAGRVVEIPRGDEDFETYTFNGIATAVLAVATLIYFGDKSNGIQFVYRNFAQWIPLSCLTAILVGSIRIPDLLRSHEREGRIWRGISVVQSWWNRLHTKLVFYRIAVITALLFNIVFLAKTVVLPAAVPFSQWNVANVTAFAAGIRADVATTTTASMVIIYCMDALIFEHHLSSSFELQYESNGVLSLLRWATFPYLLSVVPKFALDNATQLPWWIVSVMASLFLTGLVTKRCADKIKYAYRMDAQDPKFDELNGIATFQGQGIIADSLWKVVRHPNHLGEVLIYVSFLPLLTVRFAWAPLVALLNLIAIMGHRAYRVDQRSKQKYNSAWAQYSKIVPNLLVPRVY